MHPLTPSPSPFGGGGGHHADPAGILTGHPDSETRPVTDPTPTADRPATAALTTGRAVVLIAVAALFAYYNSLHAAFVLDDSLVVGHHRHRHLVEVRDLRRSISVSRDGPHEGGATSMS